MFWGASQSSQSVSPWTSESLSGSSLAPENRKLTEKQRFLCSKKGKFQTLVTLVTPEFRHFIGFHSSFERETFHSELSHQNGPGLWPYEALKNWKRWFASGRNKKKSHWRYLRKDKESYYSSGIPGQTTIIHQPGIRRPAGVFCGRSCDKSCNSFSFTYRLLLGRNIVLNLHISFYGFLLPPPHHHPLHTP